SSDFNESNRGDPLNYSRYYVKRLKAEQLMDSIDEITGVPEKYPGFMIGTRALSIPQGAPSYFLQTFGRMKAREVICERDNQPDMAQAMHLITGAELQRKAVEKGGRLDRWMADPAIHDREIVERLYLAALVRPPDNREMALALAPIEAQ